MFLTRRIDPVPGCPRWCGGRAAGDCSGTDPHCTAGDRVLTRRPRTHIIPARRGMDCWLIKSWILHLGLEWWHWPSAGHWLRCPGSVQWETVGSCLSSSAYERRCQTPVDKVFFQCLPFICCYFPKHNLKSFHAKCNHGCVVPAVQVFPFVSRQLGLQVAEDYQLVFLEELPSAKENVLIQDGASSQVCSLHPLSGKYQGLPAFTLRLDNSEGLTHHQSSPSDCLSLLLQLNHNPVPPSKQPYCLHSLPGVDLEDTPNMWAWACCPRNLTQDIKLFVIPFRWFNFLCINYCEMLPFAIFFHGHCYVIFSLNCMLIRIPVGNWWHLKFIITSGGIAKGTILKGKDRINRKHQDIPSCTVGAEWCHTWLQGDEENERI